MKYSTALVAALAPLALAVPVAKRQDIDTTVLQFALTLEHLENVFYKQALQKFSSQAFAAAGYGPNYYNNLKYISADEEQHVKLLSGALTEAGVTPVAACEYSFPYTDVKSFITLSTVLEGVGTSAYLGGAPLITSKEYLTVAGSILVTEAIHTSLQRNSIKAVPAANPYGTPLDPTSVYTLAAAFIKKCPSTNAALPFTPFPSLTLTTATGFCEEPDCSPVMVQKRDAEAEAEANWSPWQPASSTTAAPTTTKAPVSTTTKAPTNPTSTTPAASKLPSPPYAGLTVSFTSAADIPAGAFLTFVSGLAVVSVPGTISGKTISGTIPAGTSGQSYVFVSKSNVTAITDSAVVAGPSIVEVFPAPPSIDFSYY